MPPLRTIPAAKPIKTERTHEENQERAYIAASRRSDRSLEARVESARRASEIHKRRTGRSLRVTEQDVINEEMYEEEDDDLPMQYRRLTAHLQTSNADFDRRLAAYLTNHVAMRAALGQAVSDSYNPQQQYSNAPQFANQMQFQQSFPNPMLPPQIVPQSPQNFRQSPYPNQQHNFRPQSMHGRAASIATPHELQNMNNFTSQSSTTMFKPEDRRMSLPARTPHASQSPPRHSPTTSRSPSSTNLANLKHEAAKQGYTGQTSPQAQGSVSPPSYQTSFSNMPPGFGQNMANFNLVLPFSTTLPQESQQLLGPGLDSNDPFSQMLMGGQDSQPFYSYNPNASSSKTKGMSPPFDGINQTLAPSMLDTNVADRGGNYNTPVSGADSVITPQGGFFGFDSSYDSLKGMPTSGLTTPGEHDWANLINSHVWDDASSQPAIVN